ncbi:MAG: bifunctional oligoribonuclease/PAP phosphatase NrnA [Nitrososphaerales archaeon]
MHKKRIKQIYVVTHRLADVDAYCATYGTARLLRTISKNSKVNVVFPEGLNTIARKVSEKFPMCIENGVDFAKADLIAIVDTNNPFLLAESMQSVMRSKAIKVLIDHHPLGKSGKKIADIMFIDTIASSASEIVFNLYRTNKIDISKRVAQVLLLGIMADSQHLFLANGKTIAAVYELHKRGASLESAKKILTRERGHSERMARLKAASRISLYRADIFIVAFSRIGSFHSSVAKALIDLGADLAIAIGGDEKESKASLRATQHFYKVSKLHLGIDIASKLSDSGGGHPTAASLSSKVIDANNLERLLLNELRAKLGKINALR